MRPKKILIPAIILIVAFLGCAPASQHRKEVRDDIAEKITVGTVQRKIDVGMSSADVIEVLGSPNVVTTDENRREVWVYDKIATETVYSTSAGGVYALILGGVAGGSSAGAGGIAPGYSQGAGAHSKTQRTLTILIKYDEKNKVRDFAYRQSIF